MLDLFLQIVSAAIPVVIVFLYMKYLFLFRHEMQLEKSLSQTSQSSKFLHGVLIKEKAKIASVNQADPMNNLEDIMETITYKPFKRKHKKHGKDDGYKLGCALECCVKVDDTVETSCDKCEISGTDCPLEHRMPPVATCMERPPDFVSKDNGNSNSVESQNKLIVPKVDTCVPINDEDIESIPEHVIRSYKLSAEEIKKIPRFENYDTGEPNNVSLFKYWDNDSVGHITSSKYQISSIEAVGRKWSLAVS